MTQLTKTTPTDRLLTRHEFLIFQDIPPEAEWFAEINNPHTRRNYRNDVQEFLRFLGIQSSDELRQVQPAHIIAWRKALLEATYQPRGKSSPPRKYSHATIRRKLAAVSSLFETLVEKQAMTHNQTKGVKRPSRPSEKTPILPDELTARLLDAPE